MTGTRLGALVAIAAVIIAMTTSDGRAIDITWDGGDGLWDDTNWNSGEDLFSLIGTANGSNGWGGPNDGEMENIIISGATSSVVYDANSLGEDFRMKQGSTLTISDGATWAQVSLDDWSENRWTEMDISSLVIDGGTFSRVGAVGPEGGGAMIFGSWRGDDNFGEPDSELDYMETQILITNGGRLENEGQLWFGGWGDTPPNGTVVVMTINDGTLDLTGGDVPGVGDAGDADLVFTNRFLDDFDLPTYAINFTGPGSIIVDESGIINAYLDENQEWQDVDPITYEVLWDEGILQADGKSGLDGEQFSKYFTVSGSLGNDNYTLTFAANTVPGDFDGDGQLTATDIDDLTRRSASLLNPLDYDLNDDQKVDDADVKVWIEDLYTSWLGDANLDNEFNSGDLVAVLSAGTYEIDVDSAWTTGDFNGDGRTNSGDLVTALAGGGYEMGPRPAPAAAAAVPEPAGFVLALLGLLSIGQLGRSRR